MIRHFFIISHYLNLITRIYINQFVCFKIKISLKKNKLPGNNRNKTKLLAFFVLKITTKSINSQGNSERLFIACEAPSPEGEPAEFLPPYFSFFIIIFSL